MSTDASLTETRLSELVAYLQGPPRRLAFLMHTKPDGDALGSTLGLSAFLQGYGHACAVVAPSAVPAGLAWLPGADTLLVDEPESPAARAALQAAELLFCMDFSRTNRVHELRSTLEAVPAERRVLLDHHLAPDLPAQYVLHDVQASSTCELAFRLITRFQAPERLSPAAATCLYTGLVTDTRGFRIPATRAAVLQAAAALVAAGAEPHAIDIALHQPQPESRIRFWGYCLYERLTLRRELRLAYITLPLDLQQQYDLQEGDTEGLVNEALQVAGVELSILLTETATEIRMSTRSVGSFDASSFCQHFGGGGHFHAAGARLHTRLDEALVAVLAHAAHIQGQMHP